MSTKSTLKAIPMALAIAGVLAFGGLAQAQTGGATGGKGAAGEGQGTTMPSGSGMGASGSGTTGMGMSGSQATTPPGTTKPKDDLASPAPTAGSAGKAGKSGSGSGMGNSAASGSGTSGSAQAGSTGSKASNPPGSTKSKDSLITPEPTAGSAAKSSKGQAEPKAKASRDGSGS